MRPASASDESSHDARAGGLAGELSSSHDTSTRGRVPRVQRLPVGTLASRGDRTGHFFRAADGTVWSVHERDTREMPTAHRPCCLVFETEKVLRLVWDYPAHWRALEEGALEALSETR